MELDFKTLGLLALAFGIPLGLTPFVKKLALLAGAVDRPGVRKLHTVPVPSWGGLGIWLGFTAAVLLAVPLTREIWGLLAGGLLVLLVGLVDDRRGLSPWAKLAGQVAAAGILVAFGITVDFVTNPLGGMIYLGIFSIPVTIAWVVGITNALNLVDGLDGLAAGVAAISAVTVAVVAFGQGAPIVAWCALYLAAAALGFLPHNFHPARIFMGDGGSMFLGFMLAALAVLGLTKSATAFSLILPILILGIPIFDMLFAIVRRILRGQHIFAPDRDHLHHRLLDLGLSQRQTALVIYGVNLLLGGSAVLLTRLTTEQGVVVLLILITSVLLAADRVGLFTVSQAAPEAERPAPAPRGGGRRSRGRGVRL
ncbi:MAG: undecaprenyl/decaprenyl-phosphate alpha-N-acetylglucosaminyl 1-phosphate transferase [Firmicutes bacterium]|nr:undecaprenyl/decaprenyl-phosphate alpha-N-acetylglucosaminyl 1-phosphate transferase [Bacillota bacterium]